MYAGVSLRRSFPFSADFGTLAREQMVPTGSCPYTVTLADFMPFPPSVLFALKGNICRDS
jgi:hypothetical protein